MSGHSKWAQIKRQKGVADVKKGQIFTKIAKAITIAVREGRGVTDPSQNFKLRLTIDKARSVNMPKDNIIRAIEKGKGGGKGDEIQEITYEGFGPGGTALIIEAATDNKLRTTAEVKNTLEKNGGTMCTMGAVSYQFETKGLITIKKGDKSLDDIFLIAADGGAEDMEEAGREVLIYTKPDELGKVRDELSGKLSIINAELTRKPTITANIADKNTSQKILSLIEKLEDLDDVQKVYSNFDIPDELINE
ncbi:MAG: hypothetical protein A3H79_00010 [Candidatus Levybacteria bacterium RIFCSPLOWO2_02_FULL_36_8b]|nr:MAG: hypothetical protein A3H79_00010 [Candidatus Levybacteria bacterium RIFCSPLOWO2_02_FULL_36_8b]